MEQVKKNIWIIIAVVVIVVLAAFYIVRRGQKKPNTPRNLQVPQVEIQNNPVEKKIPEINPVEKANPFKYKNPLLK